MSSLCKIVVIGMLLGIVGCTNSPAQKPSKAQIVGKYVLSAQSIAFLKHDKGYASVPSSYIVLRSDGEAVIHEMPDCYIDGFGLGNHKFVGGQGTWQVESTDSGFGVTIEIQGGGTMPRGIYSGSSIILRGKRWPFQLHVGIGDPDSDEWLTFNRVGS